MIPIKNIYYMLAYVFKATDRFRYDDLAVEPFENASELFAALLIRGINYQLKRGLHHDYFQYTEPLSSPRGKIEVAESIKQRAPQRLQLVCTHDTFTSNTYLNRILKTTMLQLLKANVSAERKKELHKLLLYFTDIQVLNTFTIDWHIHYDNNNQSYRMLMGVCYLTLNGLLQTKRSGQTRVLDFLDGRKESQLYEQFILAYFKATHAELNPSSPHISWALDNNLREMLPTMRTDVTLSTNQKTLIIDAKYYRRIAQVFYGNATISSNNVYQIYSYVKNYQENLKRQRAYDTPVVSGMLLYAGTDEAVQPNYTYQMHGNTIAVRTLNLNLEFPQIAAQLDAIAQDFLG